MSKLYTTDELIRDEAKRLAAEPPEPISGAENLPDDVRDGTVEDASSDDDGSTHEHKENE